ncbi:MAG: hypothetical protein BWX72_00548 [Firmicutes bacterium ADurb.Bin080]|nr:MAG: hypothetical protein BWX72_00548 [Firmicutes bacterium ADurb.Bin080]
MIKNKVSKEKIEEWKRIYEQEKDFLIPNRISGKELNQIFKNKYKVTRCSLDKFEDVVMKNAKDYGEENPDVIAYIVEEDVMVGIDIKSGYFQVESNNLKNMESIWDDLFLIRGLSKNDIENYVIAAQYLELIK